MKNVRITFGISELLVVFSFLMFEISKTFSITAFCLGVFGRVCTFAMEINDKNEEEKAAAESLNKLGTMIAQFVDGATSGAITKKDKSNFH